MQATSANAQGGARDLVSPQIRVGGEEVGARSSARYAAHATQQGLELWLRERKNEEHALQQRRSRLYFMFRTRSHIFFAVLCTEMGGVE